MRAGSSAQRALTEATGLTHLRLETVQKTLTSQTLASYRSLFQKLINFDDISDTFSRSFGNFYIINIKNKCINKY